MDININSVDEIMDINRKRKLSSASNGDDKSEQQDFSNDEGISLLPNSDDEDGDVKEDNRTTSEDLDTQRVSFKNVFGLFKQNVI